MLPSDNSLRLHRPTHFQPTYKSQKRTPRLPNFAARTGVPELHQRQMAPGDSFAPTGPTWFRRWNQVLADLSKNASSCRLAPENDDHDDEIRNLVFNTRRGKKYRALFVIRENVVFVTNVRGPGQDLVAPDELKLPD